MTGSRDPLRGMALDMRQQFDRAPLALREAYLAWWIAGRGDKRRGHRDAFPAFVAGWEAGQR